jgi:glucose-6-phosphate isomerase
MKQVPFFSDISLPVACMTECDNHIIRTLSSMKGQYLDRSAYEAMLRDKDEALYEVYEIKRPETTGELMYGLSVVHPGKVGDEYFMTKGHFHSVPGTAEVYHCLRGEGVMVMETPEGESAVEELRPGRLLYVPPRWAHRSVNTGVNEDLVTLFVYPANAGHDYGTIEQQGMKKLVVERKGRPEVIDNPRWKGGR